MPEVVDQYLKERFELQERLQENHSAGIM